MRYLTLGVLVSLCSGSAVLAQATDPKIVAPVTKFIDAFNKGDAAAAAATHAADVTIIDEVAPFVWRGAQAFKTWSADLEAEAKKRGITDEKVTLSPATRVETSGRDAYVVVPGVYTFKEAGVAMREIGQMTFALKEGAGGWLIHSWTWTGRKPEKAPAPAKK